MPEDADDDSLEPHYTSITDRLAETDCSVRATENLPATLAFRMAHIAREVLRLGVYLRGLGILAQIPGAADYRYLYHGDDEDDAPAEADEPNDWIQGANAGTVLGVLTECLRRLDAADVMKWIPEAKHIRPEELSTKWQRYLNREAKFECGLLNVVAECLDELLVRPGLAAIDRGPQTTWWENYWSRIEDY